MKKNLFLLLVLLVVFTPACTKLFLGDEELSLPRQHYTGNELRIDGYYYHKYYPSENEVYCSTCFFMKMESLSMAVQ